MARSKQGVRARMARATDRRRKKPTSRVERAFDDVKQLVSDAGDLLFGQSGERKADGKQVSTRKVGAARIGSGKQRQTAAKKAGASRIRSGQKRQAAAKKAARKRGAKTS